MNKQSTRGQRRQAQNKPAAAALPKTDAPAPLVRESCLKISQQHAAVFTPKASPSSGIPAAFPAILRAVLPAHKTRERNLARQVAQLSEMLTTRRSELRGRSYWSTPGLAAAYLWYFLPWNLLRLTSLLPGLKLELRPGSKCLDIGSGPLTLPLALWLGRPELRTLPLNFTCLDTAAPGMRLGLELFKELTGPDAPWRFTLISEPLQRILSKHRDTFDLVTACNVLNELPPGRQTTFSGHISQLTANLIKLPKAGGQLLLVEPGNRLGGKIISQARQTAMGRGCLPLSPCTHARTCPFERREAGMDARQIQSSWCHFTGHRLNSSVPAWLNELSRAARSGKESLSLSFVQLQKPETAAAKIPSPEAAAPNKYAPEKFTPDKYTPDKYTPEKSTRENTGATKVNLPPSQGSISGRVISHLLPLPERQDNSYYLCTEQGLALLHTAQKLPHGSAVDVCLHGTEEKDPKSGAWIITD